MSHSSKAFAFLPVRVRRIRPIAAPIVVTLVTAPALVQLAHAQDVTLRMSREISAPYLRGAPVVQTDVSGAPDAAASRIGDTVSAPVPALKPAAPGASRQPRCSPQSSAVSPSRSTSQIPTVRRCLTPPNATARGPRREARRSGVTRRRVGAPTRTREAAGTRPPRGRVVYPLAEAP